MASIQKENLWSSFLRESSKRSQSQESTCFIVGDKGCGKKNEIVSYQYLDIDDKYLESVSRVNFWTFEERIFNDAYDILKSSSHLQMIILIALDLSNSDGCIDSLKSWLWKVSAFCSKFYKLDNSEQIKQSLAHYLANIRVNKGDMTKSYTDDILNDTTTSDPDGISLISFETEERNRFLRKYFGFPIVVVACKSDLMEMDSSITMKRSRELQGQIRSICLDIGAALIYTSTVPSTVALSSMNSTSVITGTVAPTGNGNNIVGGVNCAELKKYLLHRLYPEQIAMELSIEDKLESTFIPAGFDTIDMINISSGLKLSLGDYRKKFEAKEANNDKTITNESDASNNIHGSNVVEYKLTEIENEQTFLQVLHQHLLQMSSTAATFSTSTGSGKIVPAAPTANNSESYSPLPLSDATATTSGNSSSSSVEGNNMGKELQLENVATSNSSSSVNTEPTRRASAANLNTSTIATTNNTGTRRSTMRTIPTTTTTTTSTSDANSGGGASEFFKSLLEKK